MEWASSIFINIYIYIYIFYVYIMWWSIPLGSQEVENAQRMFYDSDATSENHVEHDIRWCTSVITRRDIGIVSWPLLLGTTTNPSTILSNCRNRSITLRTYSDPVTAMCSLLLSPFSSRYPEGDTREHTCPYNIFEFGSKVMTLHKCLAEMSWLTPGLRGNVWFIVAVHLSLLYCSTEYSECVFTNRFL